MLISLGLLKKTSRKQFTVSNRIHSFEQKNLPDTLHYFTCDFFLYRGNF